MITGTGHRRASRLTAAAAAAVGFAALALPPASAQAQVPYLGVDFGYGSGVGVGVPPSAYGMAPLSPIAPFYYPPASPHYYYTW